MLNKLGTLLVTLGVFLLQSGLKLQGKKLEVMLRADIKKIFRHTQRRHAGRRTAACSAPDGRDRPGCRNGC